MIVNVYLFKFAVQIFVILLIILKDFKFDYKSNRFARGNRIKSLFLAIVGVNYLCVEEEFVLLRSSTLF